MQSCLLSPVSLVQSYLTSRVHLPIELMKASAAARFAGGRGIALAIQL